MKTIVIEFFAHGRKVPVARATGRFATLPGDGKVLWEGDLTAYLKPPYFPPLPTEHYAGNFASALCAMAERSGLIAEVSETGDWRVFTE